MKKNYQFIDLTHTLDPNIPSWNGSCGFEYTIKQDYDKEASLSFRVNQIKMHAGIGTHMDAPAHCYSNGKTIAELDIDNLVANCVVINVQEKCLDNPKFQVSPDDLFSFEVEHGEIKPDSFVIFYTGWAKFWNHPAAYRNNLIFPSISEMVAKLLLERNIKGLGIDTLSPDAPQDGKFPVHQLLLGAGKYIIENVANANLLPPIGSRIFALPLKIAEGTEAPLRLIAEIPLDTGPLIKKMNALLKGLSNEDHKISWEILNLLKLNKIIAAKFDGSRKEFYLEFDNGTRLFIDNVQKAENISITT